MKCEQEPVRALVRYQPGNSTSVVSNAPFIKRGFVEHRPDSGLRMSVRLSPLITAKANLELPIGFRLDISRCDFFTSPVEIHTPL